MPDPQELVLDLMYGRWRSQIMYTGVKLGVFEVLTGAAKPAGQVARELGLDPTFLYRLLRALGSIGLLEEHPERHFSLSEAGKFLRADHPQSLRGLTLLVEGPEHYAVWKHLANMVQDGKQDGFVREYGLAAFEYAARQPSYAEAFDAGMSSHSRLQAAWVLDALRAYDFSPIAQLCDVGGGQGYLLCRFLLQYPHLMGTVLERASVIENSPDLWAEKLGVSDRCRYVAGDMFVDVPPADAYIMKMILHDWNDEECIQILQVIQRCAPPGGRVFIAEHLIPGIDTPHFAKLFDIHMMAWGTGRERTVEEYAALLHNAGWRFAASWFPSKGRIGLVEGVKV